MIRTWTPESDEHSWEREKVREIRKWFGLIRQETQAVEDQKGKIRRMKAAITKTTPGMNGMPGGSGSGDKIGNGVTRIIEEEDRLRKMEQALERRKIEAYRRILFPLGNELFYNLKMIDYLEGYYLDCKSTDKSNNFQLITYERLAERKRVDVSTIKKSMSHAFQILTRYWDTF